MLYRVSGKLANGNPFSSRVEAPSAIEAAQVTQKALLGQNVGADDVCEIHSKPMAGKSSVYIGKPKAPKAKAAPSATAPKTASGGKR